MNIGRYTQRNDPANFQYKRLLNSHKGLKCIFHDFTSVLLSVTIQDVGTKGNPVNLTSVSY